MEPIIEQTATGTSTAPESTNQKFCKHCGGKIPQDAVLCTLCGRQIEAFQSTQSATPNIVINNTSSNVNTNQNINNNAAAFGLKPKNKWVALALCAFLGYFGAHKFYEGKAGMGVLYLCTCGLLGIGIIIDFITLLFKPNPYYI